MSNNVELPTYVVKLLTMWVRENGVSHLAEPTRSVLRGEIPADMCIAANCPEGVVSPEQSFFCENHRKQIGKRLP